MAKVTRKNAKIRLYDGTGTPYYLELDFEPGELSAPIGAPKTEEIIVLPRGNMSGDAHYIEGPDDPMMAPVDISFPVWIENSGQAVYLLDWLAAMNDGLTTTVNSNTLVSTENDTQRDGSNNNASLADSNKSCCNVEYLIEMGATDLGWKWAEVYFPLSEISLAEADDAITITLAGKCYGTITRITGFTSGTSVEA